MEKENEIGRIVRFILAQEMLCCGCTATGRDAMDIFAKANSRMMGEDGAVEDAAPFVANSILEELELNPDCPYTAEFKGGQMRKMLTPSASQLHHATQKTMERWNIRKEKHAAVIAAIRKISAR